MLAEKAKQANALIIGGFTPYSSLDSRTKAFIERLYPLRHIHGFMRGKPGAAGQKARPQYGVVNLLTFSCPR
jgi:multimeric flavodoxin WrbA